MIFKKPILNDISQMLDLVMPEVQKGNILMRSEEEMANTIRSYIVAEEEGKIIGFCALHIYTSKLAEIRSLIVSSSFQGKGIGSELVKRCVSEGLNLGITDFLVLTYRASLFENLGFKEIAKNEIPNHKIWADCIKCKHFPQCDEKALLKQF